MNKLYTMLLVSFSLIGMEDTSNANAFVLKPVQKVQEAKKREHKRKADSLVNLATIVEASASAAKEAKLEKEVELLKQEIAEKNRLMKSLETDFGNSLRVLKDISFKQNAQIDVLLAFTKHLDAIDKRLLELHEEAQSHRNETKKEIDGYTKFVMNTTITSVNPLIRFVVARLNMNISSQQEDCIKYRQEIIAQLNDFKSSIASITQSLQRIESQTAPALPPDDFFDSLSSLVSDPII